MIKDCEICNKSFDAHRLAKTCSLECGKVLRRMTQKNIRMRNPEKEKERSDNWRKLNPGRDNENRNKRRSILNFRVKYICNAAKTRAASIGREYNINFDYVLQIIEKQNGLCAVTGLEFDLNPHAKYFRNPLAPSLDRIDNNFGYVEGNVQIVCTFYNIMKSEWSDEDLKNFIKVTYMKLFAN